VGGQSFKQSSWIQEQVMKGNIAATVLVVLGVFFLLTNLGLIDVSVKELLRVWWPLILIAVGVGLFFTPGKKR
jgi:protein-S-isoprenylcysteine O-methyltransferase Ste14